jgi:stress response protein SCP2
LTPPPDPYAGITAITAAVALLVSIMSLLGTFAIVVRLFTKTEIRVDVIAEKLEEAAKLARVTADNFNGEGRNAHTALTARVTALEAAIGRLATIERVDAVLSEVRQGFKHLEDVIRRDRDRERSHKEDT